MINFPPTHIYNEAEWTALQPENGCFLKARQSLHTIHIAESSINTYI